MGSRTLLKSGSLKGPGATGVVSGRLGHWNTVGETGEPGQDNGEEQEPTESESLDESTSVEQPAPTEPPVEPVQPPEPPTVTPEQEEGTPSTALRLRKLQKPESVSMQKCDPYRRV